MWFPYCCILLQQDDDDDGDGPDEQRPWHKRSKVWLHIVAFALSACLLLVGVGSQFLPFMRVVSLALHMACNLLLDIPDNAPVTTGF